MSTISVLMKNVVEGRLFYARENDGAISLIKKNIEQKRS